MRLVSLPRPAVSATGEDFAAQLRQHRRLAGLSQEALAERAAMSARGISDLERDLKAPQRATVDLLIRALALTTAEARQFTLAAQARRGHRDGSTTEGQGRPAATTLPAPLTSFIGRERELAEVQEALEHTRLLTLTGTGGCGKTRLALQVAANIVERFLDGVWLVELAPLADPALVPATIAAALALRAQPGQPLETTLVHALHTKRLLLVLDNCEHLLDACARLADMLLRGCPGLTILATSRQALGIAGETSRRVPSLGLPPAESASPSEQVAGCEAVRLFVERALAVQPSFAVTPQNTAAVVQLCRRLDGIPLALELAAVWMRSLSAEQLAARLDQRFRLLAGGSRTALPRQQTLRATIDWSYELLDGQERRLFDRLSVFAGGWTLEAAESVGSGDGIADVEVLDLLAWLVDKSLVAAEEQPDGAVRYRLLESLRQYGRERLLARGEVGAVAGRHAAYYLALAEQAAPPRLQGPRRATWQRRLEPDLDNLRAALRCWLERGDAERGLRLAVVLRPFWFSHGLTAEGLRWLTALLALPGRGHTSLRGEALFSAGLFTNTQGDQARAEALMRDASVSFRAVGDRHGEVEVVGGRIIVAMYRGDDAGAVRLHEEHVALCRELGDETQIARWLLFAGQALIHTGDMARAQSCLTEALATFRQQGDQFSMAQAMQFLGEMAEACGDDAAARTQYEAALALFAELPVPDGIGVMNIHLGRLALKAGNWDEARRRFRQGLVLTREIGLRGGLCAALEGLAALAAEEGQAERALRLAGAAAALSGARVGTPVQRASTAGWLELARRDLGQQAAAAAWAEGQVLTLEQAVAEALGDGG